MQNSVRALPTGNLPKIPYSLPSQKLFATESSGAFRREWLRGLPAYRQFVENTKYLPSHDDFWKSTPSQAVTVIATRMNYHDMLNSAATDGIMPIEGLLNAPGSPTPDLIYDDIMRWKTFDRIQKPPEQQYVMEEVVLNQLLARAAHHVLLDPLYFTKAEQFFRKVEQQQNVTHAGYSCWALMCVASGRLRAALDILAFMDTHGLNFDGHVFVLCMNPGASNFKDRIRGGPNEQKGFVRQLRLLNRLESLSSTRKASVPALHAFFVMFNLTLNHVAKWELIRLAVENSNQFHFSLRTVLYAFEIVRYEGARRCGPLTIQRLLILFARHQKAELCLDLLIRVRQNEMLEEHLKMAVPVVIPLSTRREILGYLIPETSKNDMHSLAASDTFQSTLRVDEISRKNEHTPENKVGDEITVKNKECLNWIRRLMSINDDDLDLNAYKEYARLFPKASDMKISFDQLITASLPRPFISKDGATHGKLQTERFNITNTHKKSLSPRMVFLRHLLPFASLKRLHVPCAKPNKTVHIIEGSKSAKKRSGRRKLKFIGLKDSLKTQKKAASNPSNKSSDGNKPARKELVSVEPTYGTENEKMDESVTSESGILGENISTSGENVICEDHPMKPSVEKKYKGTPTTTKDALRLQKKQYVEEVPSPESPFQQDVVRRERLERVRRDKASNQDIALTQQEQAVRELQRQAKEQEERRRRLPSAWMLS